MIALPAQTIDLTFVNVSPRLTFSGSFNAPGNFAARPSGLLNFDDGSVGFCVEPTRPVGGTHTYNVQPTVYLTNYDSISKVLVFYL